MVRFRQARTETEWYRWIDATAIQVVPQWFNFLGWVLIIGAFEYLGERTKSVLCVLIVTASIGGLWCYLQAVFDAYHFADLPWATTPRSQRLASLVFSAAVCGVAWFGVQHLVRLLGTA